MRAQLGTHLLAFAGLTGRIAQGHGLVGTDAAIDGQNVQGDLRVLRACRRSSGQQQECGQ
jgi:hypothetical protein